MQKSKNLNTRLILLGQPNMACECQTCSDLNSRWENCIIGVAVYDRHTERTGLADKLGYFRKPHRLLYSPNLRVYDCAPSSGWSLQLFEPVNQLSASQCAPANPTSQPCHRRHRPGYHILSTPKLLQLRICCLARRAPPPLSWSRRCSTGCMEHLWLREKILRSMLQRGL